MSRSKGHSHVEHRDAIESKDSFSKLVGFFPHLPGTAIEQIVAYRNEVLKFTKTINLVSSSTLKNMETVHLADSVLASQLLGRGFVGDYEIFDFGSGNGFPGMIFAILSPQHRFVLIDRDTRKVEFLKHAISILGLKNVRAECLSVEDLPENSVHNAVGRGFAPLHRALLISRKSMAKGGRFFHLKSDGWASELAAVPSQLFSYWSPSLFGQYRIPDSNYDMAVILTEKIKD